jgi:rod shape-determining protein MreD
LIPFAPFLAIVMARQNYISTLRYAFICGLAMDLLTMQFRLGIYALGYCLACVAAYPLRRHFFEDKPIAISLYSALISSVATVIQLLLSWAFDQGVPFSWSLIATDLILLPIADGIYALAWFVLPIYLFKILLTISRKKRRS